MAELYGSMLQEPPAPATAVVYANSGQMHGSPLSYNGSGLVHGYDPIGQTAMSSARSSTTVLPETVQKSCGVMDMKVRLHGYGEISLANPSRYGRSGSSPPAYVLTDAVQKGHDVRPYLLGR